MTPYLFSENSTVSHPHEVLPFVVHVCHKCEKQCVMEDENKRLCEYAKYDAEMRVKLGSEVDYTSSTEKDANIERQTH